MRHGEEQIARAELEPVPNPAPDRDYRIDITFPEFTCLCPRTGYPDFATIKIHYVPDEKIVELKSFKLWLNHFRSQYVFHEAVINQIHDALVATIAPRWLQTVGDFNVRGNVHTVITCEHAKSGYAPRATDHLATTAG